MAEPGEQPEPTGAVQRQTWEGEPHWKVGIVGSGYLPPPGEFLL